MIPIVSLARYWQNLRRKDITELRNFGSPPSLVLMVMELVALLFGCPTDWANAKTLISENNFGKRFRNFEKEPRCRKCRTTGFQRLVGFADRKMFSFFFRWCFLFVSFVAVSMEFAAVLRSFFPEIAMITMGYGSTLLTFGDVDEETNISHLISWLDFPVVSNAGQHSRGCCCKAQSSGRKYQNIDLCRASNSGFWTKSCWKNIETVKFLKFGMVSNFEIHYNLVGGLEHELYPPIHWECHHPNWRTPSFFWGVAQPPTSNLFMPWPISWVGVKLRSLLCHLFCAI